MPRDASETKARILKAASALFYADGIRAVSVDAVAEKAGVTKRTLYSHIRSKDDLIHAYLEGRDQPNLRVFKRWFAAAEGDLGQKTKALFDGVAASSRHPKWTGCGFLRTAAELANLPGHPAVKAGSAHKKRVEAWLADVYADQGVPDAPALARQVVLLLDGAFSTMLVHRDRGYIDAAGDAAATLVSHHLSAG